MKTARINLLGLGLVVFAVSLLTACLDDLHQYEVYEDMDAARADGAVGLVYWYLQKQCPPDWITAMGGMDEATSVAYTALIECARSFDPSHGTKFSTYAVAAIRLRCMRESARRSRARKRHADTVRHHSREVTDDDIASFESQRDVLVEVEIVQRMLDNEKVINPVCAETFRLWVRGMTQSELATTYGVSAEAIRCRIDLVRRKLRERLKRVRAEKEELG